MAKDLLLQLGVGLCQQLIQFVPLPLLDLHENAVPAHSPTTATATVRMASATVQVTRGRRRHVAAVTTSPPGAKFSITRIYTTATPR